MSKISGYNPITSVQTDDLLAVVDVHDTSMAPTGTTKKMTVGQLPAPSVYQAWQFLPESYGAKGDGRIISDAVLNSTTTLTSASAAFTSADTGKHIMINGAIGGTNIPLIATMTFVNATTVTLSSTATVSGSGFVAIYGTDDTTAINSAVTAAKAYALANQYFAEVVFAAKYYILASGPTQSASPQFNSQVPMPYPNVNGATQKLVIALTGAGDNGFYQYWASLTPNVVGTALVSMTLAPTTVSATFGQQSVIGGPSAGGGFTGGFANTKVVVRGIEVVCSAYTNQYAYDFGYVSAMRVQQSSAHIFAPAGIGGGNSPLIKDLPSQAAFTNTIGCGLRAPTGQNNADTTAEDFTSEGYARGLYLFDHFQGGRISTIYNDVAVVIDPTLGSSLQHAIVIAMLGAEAYNGGILVAGGSSGQIPVYINLDAECGAPAYDISDTGGALRGVVHWMDPADNRLPGINGAANLKVINDRLGPGHMASPPAVPAASAASVPVYRDAWVIVTGGTNVAISLDGTSTGLTSGAVRVASGKTVSLGAYTVAPTWQWWLD